MQFQARHVGGRTLSLRRFISPLLPSGCGMGSSQGTALCREGGERDFSNRNQAASTNDGKKNYLCLRTRLLSFKFLVSVHDWKQKSSGVLELSNQPQPGPSRRKKKDFLSKKFHGIFHQKSY